MAEIPQCRPRSFGEYGGKLPGVHGTPPKPRGYDRNQNALPAIYNDGRQVHNPREPMSGRLKAPFPWFGGKSRVAALVWSKIGDVDNYIEPFCGSAAVLLARPTAPRVETVSDLDCYVSNFWRAVQHDPEAVAEYADWPVNECVPAGTMIATPAGDVPVESIRPGMVVWGEDAGRVVPTTVLATKRTVTRYPLFRVGPLSLTGNHPVWTRENGYVNAADLVPSHTLAMICNHGTNGQLSGVWETVQGEAPGREVLLLCLHGAGVPQPREGMPRLREDVPCQARQQEPTLLLAELRAAACLEEQPGEHAEKCRRGAGGTADERGRTTATSGMAAVAGEPHQRPGRPATVPGRPQGERARRARLASDEGAAAPHRAPTNLAESAWFGMAPRGHGEDLRARRADARRATAGTPALLVSSGHGPARSEARHRGRRGLSPGPQCARPAARRDPLRSRLANPALQQPPHPHQPGQGDCGDRGCRPVFNFQTVTGNYFAAGILVHNCDLHSRHRFLVGVSRPDPIVPPRFDRHPLLREAYLAGYKGEHPSYAAAFRQKMRQDPDFYDVRIAGWWCWGACAWIGGGWCQAADLERNSGVKPDLGRHSALVNGPGTVCHEERRPLIAAPGSEGGRGVHATGPGLDQTRPVLEERGVHGTGPGLCEQLPMLTGHTGTDGRGVHDSRLASSHRPQLADAYGPGRGVHATGEKVGEHGEPRPRLECAYSLGQGVHAGGGLSHSERRSKIDEGVHYGNGVHQGNPANLGTCAQRRAWLCNWFGRLRDRLRTVRVCCGHWLRVCDSESVTTRLGTVGLFLDPPYRVTLKDGKANRSQGLYASESDVVDEVLAYCLERGPDTRYRIAVCGYEGEGYEALASAGWEQVEWRAQGGYSNRNKSNKNRDRERIWFSPGCSWKAKEPCPLFDYVLED